MTKLLFDVVDLRPQLVQKGRNRSFDTSNELTRKETSERRTTTAVDRDVLEFR